MEIDPAPKRINPRDLHAQVVAEAEVLPSQQPYYS
jgi:hypothetical protein